MTDEKIIVSLTTIPSRIGILPKALESLYKQTAFNRVEKIILNVDDNVDENVLKKYRELQDCILEVKLRDPKWRSCNKLIDTYLENQDKVIFCMDDDKVLPETCLQELFEVYDKNPDCIVCYETNPVVRRGIRLDFINGMNLKFQGKTWSKFLSNVILFPPHWADPQTLLDYEKMMKLTNGCHDELFFWVVACLNKVQSIDLDYTFSLELDETSLPDEGERLCKINSVAQNIKKYNDNLNEIFGEKLNKIFDEIPCVFKVTHSTAQGFLCAIPYLNGMYNGFYLKIDLSALALSWRKVIFKTLAKYDWHRIEIV